MVSNLLETDIETTLNAAFDDDDSSLLVVDPSAETIVTLINAAADRDDLPTLAVLAAEQTLKRVMDDFLVASRAADLIAAEQLSFRVLTSAVDNSLFVSPSRVVVLVGVGDNVAALSTEDEAFVASVYTAHDNAFTDASPYQLRTPPISRVRETLAAEIGQASREDFDAVLSSMASDDSIELDEVTVSLLVAAKNNVLLYDISKWGEDVGIASKATFSRTKTRLEDLGVIDTEKVPIDVGRPRLRLKLGDERLHGVNTDELAAHVIEMGA